MTDLKKDILVIGLFLTISSLQPIQYTESYNYYRNPISDYISSQKNIITSTKNSLDSTLIQNSKFQLLENKSIILAQNNSPSGSYTADAFSQKSFPSRFNNKKNTNKFFMSSPNQN